MLGNVDLGLYSLFQLLFHILHLLLHILFHFLDLLLHHHLIRFNLCGRCFDFSINSFDLGGDSFCDLSLNNLDLSSYTFDFLLNLEDEFLDLGNFAGEIVSQILNFLSNVPFD